jgi:nucleoid-associated protein YgaU
VVAVTLAARVAGLAANASSERADGLVELAVLAAGVLVLLWLAGSALLAAACVAARGLGLVWRRGERCVQRFAPALVRRALVVVVAAGVGAASVTPASAADLSPTASPTATTVIADGDALDLGWVVTSRAPGGSPAPSHAAPTPATPEPVTVATATGSPAAATSSGTPASGPAATPGGTTSAAATPMVTHTPSSTPTSSLPALPPGAGGAADALPIPRAPLPRPLPRVAADEDATVVVVRGDTLWEIAARHLPAGASDAQVAAAWPAWYAANTATIGPDPGRILPGQVLTVPVVAR